MLKVSSLRSKVSRSSREKSLTVEVNTTLRFFGVMDNQMTKKKVSPYVIILSGFAALILIGGLLLMLPFSTKEGISAVDAFFLSASSVCITGLSSVNLSATFTTFGQAVIALLIQLGGLGFVTVGMTVVCMLGLKMGLASTRLIDETLGSDGSLDYKKFLFRAVLITLAVELFGFLLNLIALAKSYTGIKLVFVSLFHAVSSFNNAGLDLFGEGMIPFQENYLLLFSTAILTIIGGLGFIVINDVVCMRKWRKFSVHTKIVLSITPVLIVVGGCLFFFSEWGKIDFANALFMSVMARTCGFSTQDLSSWSSASLCILNLLMFIGAGPVSTGGGIKCTTAFILICSLVAFVRGKSTVVFHRRISRESVIHAMSVTVVAMIYVFLTVTVLCALESNMSELFLLTEVVSALANVGFSAGITAELCLASKIILTLAMFVGRVGFLTAFFIFRKRWGNSENEDVRYVQANVVIG